MTECFCGLDGGFGNGSGNRRGFNFGLEEYVCWRWAWRSVAGRLGDNHLWEDYGSGVGAGTETK